MDDLYTPITDMPGDSGQSASASGMTRNPLSQNTRYAKKNDIIQKYVKPTDKKYIAKSMNVRKAKLSPKWIDEILGSRINAPDTGGGGKGSDVTGFEPIEYKISPDADVTIKESARLAEQKQQYERGQKASEKLFEQERKKLIEQGEVIGTVKGRNEALGFNQYNPGSFFAIDSLPFTSLWNTRNARKAVFTHGKPAKYADKSNTIARIAYARSVSPESVDKAFDRYLQTGELPEGWAPRTVPNEWYQRGELKQITPAEDFENIKNFDTRKAKYDELWDEYNKGRKVVPKAIRNIFGRGITTGAVGYAAAEGLKGGWNYLWGDKPDKREQDYIDSANVAQTPTPTPSAKPSSNSGKNRIGEPDLDPNVFKNLKKRNGFAGKSNMAKAFGGKTGEEFWAAMKRTVDSMNDPDPLWRATGENSWKKELRDLGIDENMSPADFQRYYNNPNWDIASIAQKNPYNAPPKKVGRVGMGKKPKNSSTSPSSNLSSTVNTPPYTPFGFHAGPLEVTWNSQPKPKPYGPNPKFSTKAGNAATAIGQAMVSTPKRAAITGVAGTLGVLGLLGGGAYMLTRPPSNPDAAAGDTTLPIRTMLPTMTPTRMAESSTDSGINPTPTYTNRQKRDFAQATMTTRGKKWDEDKKKDMDYQTKNFLNPVIQNLVDEEYSNLGRSNIAQNINRINEKQRQFSDIGQSADETNQWRNREKGVREGMKNLSNPYWDGTKGPWYKELFGKSSNSKMGKRANVRKATSVVSQSSPYSQTAYVQPATSARFSLMTPEKQGAAIINSVSENTKQNYKNTSSFLNNVLSNAIKDTVNAANYATGFARGAIGAADEQTQFSNKILPQMIVAGRQANQTGKEVAGKSLQVANVGKQFVVLAVKESAKGMPEMSGKLSSKAIKNEVDRIVSESPAVVKQLYDIGKKVLNKADELQPGVKKQFINTVKNAIDNSVLPTNTEWGDRFKTIGEKSRTGRYDESNFAERITKPIRDYGEILSPSKPREFGPKFDSYVRRENYYPSTGTARDSYTTGENSNSKNTEKQPKSMQYLDILNRGKPSSFVSPDPVSAFERGKTTKRMSKRAGSMMFSKRLESPKDTQSQQTNNKYF